ncbi:MAG: protoglobin domain-containing protein, partial [Asticcacaulis sp.]
MVISVYEREVAVSLSDTTDINPAQRLAFARISARDISVLRTVWPIIEPSLDQILDSFYRHIHGEAKLSTMIGDSEGRLKNAQKKHWKNLFTDGFSATYFENAHRIGQTHYRIGLEPKWYIAAYQFVLDEVVDGQIKAQLKDKPTGTTFRWHTRRLTQDGVGWYYILDTVLGPATDQPITQWDECFLPVKLSGYLPIVKVQDPAGNLV